MFAAVDPLARIVSIVGVVFVIATYVRDHRRVRVRIAGTFHTYSQQLEDGRASLGFVPLIAVSVTSLGRDLSIENIELEWRDEIPRPGTIMMRLARPSFNEGLELKYPIPAHNGETVRALLEVCVSREWEGHRIAPDSFPSAKLRAAVTMSNRHRPYRTNDDENWLYQGEGTSPEFAPNT